MMAQYVPASGGVTVWPRTAIHDSVAEDRWVGGNPALRDGIAYHDDTRMAGGL